MRQVGFEPTTFGFEGTLLDRFKSRFGSIAIGIIAPWGVVATFITSNQNEVAGLGVLPGSVNVKNKRR
jgi:hypothetical protein